MLDRSAILACMPVEFNAVPEPDDFDQQLRDLTSGQAEPAKFTELSAAERARRVSRPPPAPHRLSWRKARKAKQLRKPPGGSQDPRGRKQSGRGGPGGQGAARPGNPRRRSASSGRQRMISIARTAGIIIGFVVLLIVLHLLGFGPR
ncbi:MAG TPA: hypothetical protein VFQ44_23330 [Streptosporangiaceae bacterium]|nr:hypothetical protein [Streptosporangiaceae bacterium]